MYIGYIEPLADYIRFVGISLHFYLLSIKTWKKSIGNLHKHDAPDCTSAFRGYPSARIFPSNSKTIQISVCGDAPTGNASRTASDEWLPCAARLRTAVQISVCRSPKPSLGGRGTAASAVVDEGRFLTFTAFSWSFLLFFPHPSALRAAT
mgnify:CR=1 FL=1